MRIILLFVLLISAATIKAQTFIPGGLIDNNYRGNFSSNFYPKDSTSNKKWSLTKYSSISTSFTFFKGGNATVVSAPIGLQLNRRLNNNLYAFAGVSVAPAYVTFSRSFMTSDFNKVGAGNNSFRSASLGIYSRAELGLQYINDEKTFSISGSIGIERNNYPVYMPVNNFRSYPVISASR